MKKENKKVLKNEFGYIEARLKQLIIINIIALGLPLAIWGTGMLVYKSNANLLTLVAVLGMLPAAQQIVGLIMIIRARKHQCSAELHEEIKNLVMDKLEVRYDFYITSYDVQFPVQALVVAEDSIIGYTVSSNFNHEKFNEHIKNLLAQNSLSVSVIKIFDDKDKEKFMKRLEVLTDKEYQTTDRDNNVLKLLENISL